MEKVLRANKKSRLPDEYFWDDLFKKIILG
jgi:hypothetical protein